MASLRPFFERHLLRNFVSQDIYYTPEIKSLLGFLNDIIDSTLNLKEEEAPLTIITSNPEQCKTKVEAAIEAEETSTAKTLLQRANYITSREISSNYADSELPEILRQNVFEKALATEAHQLELLNPRHRVSQEAMQYTEEGRGNINEYRKAIRNLKPSY